MAKNSFKNPRSLLISIFKNIKFLPPKLYIPLQYEHVTGKKLNLKKPITFNEKIQWYKIYYKNPLFNQLADKLSVRSYVELKVGKLYLNELLGIYETPDSIDFTNLPEKFVLKCVHGSGFNIIVKDKSKLNGVGTKKILKKWQLKNFYNKGKEWAYKGIKPLIVVEKFLEDENSVIPDYKFFCFDGEIKFIQVDLERKIKDYRCYYDTDWMKLNFYTEKNVFFEGEVKKPANLEDMIYVAKKLSEGIPFVRVDLYSVNNKTIFGEMTFYPTNGTKAFVPEEMNTTIGNYFKLPNKM